MERYDYLQAVKDDVLEYIRDNYSPAELAVEMEDRDDFADRLHDDLWIEDSVTGNASGSYTFNTWKAEEYIAHNWDLIGEMVDEFGLSGKDLMKGAEYLDVSIRCYLLGSAISQALDELED